MAISYFMVTVEFDGGEKTRRLLRGPVVLNGLGSLVRAACRWCCAGAGGLGGEERGGGEGGGPAAGMGGCRKGWWEAPEGRIFASSSTTGMQWAKYPVAWPGCRRYLSPSPYASPSLAMSVFRLSAIGRSDSPLEPPPSGARLALSGQAHLRRSRSSAAPPTPVAPGHDGYSALRRPALCHSALHSSWPGFPKQPVTARVAETSHERRVIVKWETPGLGFFAAQGSLLRSHSAGHARLGMADELLSLTLRARVIRPGVREVQFRWPGVPSPLTTIGNYRCVPLIQAVGGPVGFRHVNITVDRVLASIIHYSRVWRPGWIGLRIFCLSNRRGGSGGVACVMSCHGRQSRVLHS